MSRTKTFRCHAASIKESIEIERFLLFIDAKQAKVKRIIFYILTALSNATKDAKQSERGSEENILNLSVRSVVVTAKAVH